MDVSKKLFDDPELLQHVLDAFPAPVFVKDAAGVYAMCNAAFEAYLGLSREKIVGKTVHEVAPPELAATYEKADNDLLAEPPTQVYEAQVRYADGTCRDVEFRKSTFPGPDGKPAGILGVIFDISDRNRALKEAFYRERQFKALVENAPDVIARFDRGLRHVYVNPAIERAAGATPASFVGKSCRELGLEGEMLQRWESALQSVFETGKETETELQYELDSGIHWYQSRLIPERDTGGDIETVLVVARNTTEQRTAAEALRESEERYRRLAETISEILYKVNAQGIVTYVSPAVERVTGRKVGDVIGTHFIELVHPDDRSRLRERFARWKDEMLPPTEAQLVAADGTAVHVRVSSNKVTEAGRFAGVTGVIVNIDDQKRAELEKDALKEQLVLAQKMEAVGRLAGGVAHDFNNILTVIQGYANLIVKSNTIDPQTRADVEEIRASAARAAELTQQLLAFSRRQVIRPRVVDLNDLVARSRKVLQRTIGEDIALEVTAGADLHPVRIDPGQIDQILFNLAVNSREAMPDGGTIRIETANAELDESACAGHENLFPGEYVMISVGDTGPGIAEENLGKIFEPFFSTKELGGAGLGLSTVYGIVRQNEGAIFAASREGGGALFRIYFPRHRAGVAAAEQDAPAQPKGHGETILVVEDDARLRVLTERLLEAAGFQVISATGGREALAAIETPDRSIDLLLTDVVMPGMNGKEVFEACARRLPGLKVVYMSGYAEEVIARHGVLEDGTRFVQKPFDEERIVAAVREALDGGNG